MEGGGGTRFGNKYNPMPSVNTPPQSLTLVFCFRVFRRPPQRWQLLQRETVTWRMSTRSWGLGR